MPRLKSFPYEASFNDFSMGWDNISSSAERDPRSLLDCKNLNINQQKGVETRGGITLLYPSQAEVGSPVKDLHEYKAPNGTNYVLTAILTKLKAYFNAQWNDLKTGLASGKRFSFVNHNGFCLCLNGTDPNFQLYNTTVYNLGIDPPSHGGATGENLIKNGSFTEDIDPPLEWASVSGAVLTTEGGGKIGNCLMITEGGVINPSAIQNPISVTAGKNYEFTFHVKRGTEASYTVWVYDVTHSTSIWIKTGEATTNWSEFTHTFTAPAGCTAIYIRLFQMASAFSGTTLYYDEVSLYETTIADTPTVSKGSQTGLTGTYKYIYCYRRSDPKVHTGNPSLESETIEVTNESIKVSVVASTDPQVDQIVLYRTLDLFGEDADSTMFFKVVELSNSTQDYDDNNNDNDLTTICDYENDVPPKAKYAVLHKDRVFYAYCPDETDGKHLVVWSKAGIGEAVPTINHHYFDRDDGEEITGIASVGDFLVIFKRNKYAVIEGDFDRIYTVGNGVGNIAPYGILSLQDKLIFLSEEGWKAFDGANLYPISEKINGLARSGYFSIDQAENYSIAYLPEKEQFQFLINHSLVTPIVPVGFFLVPLIYIDKGIPEQKSENIVSWTYHQYDNHTLTTLGAYTDSNGITKIIAGDSLGYVYQLDSGGSDDEHDIDYVFMTGWHKLGTDLIKTLRRAYLAYLTDTEGSATFGVDIDFSSGNIIETILGTDSAYCGSAYCGLFHCGVDGSLYEQIRLSGPGTGRLFRVVIKGTNQQFLSILGFSLYFRIEGHR